MPRPALYRVAARIPGIQMLGLTDDALGRPAGLPRRFLCSDAIRAGVRSSHPWPDASWASARASAAERAADGSPAASEPIELQLAAMASLRRT
jgi:hypothetical protein